VLLSSNYNPSTYSKSIKRSQSTRVYIQKNNASFKKIIPKPAPLDGYKNIPPTLTTVSRMVPIEEDIGLMPYAPDTDVHCFVTNPPDPILRDKTSTESKIKKLNPVFEKPPKRTRHSIKKQQDSKCGVGFIFECAIS